MVGLSKAPACKRREAWGENTLLAPALPALEAALEKEQDEVVEYVVREVKRKVAGEKNGTSKS